MIPKVERILVPIDFSESTGAALSWTRLFSKPPDTPILMLHVVDSTRYGEPLSGLVPKHSARFFNEIKTEIRDSATAKLEELAESLRDEGHQVQTAVTEGEPFVEIVRFAKENHVDLIVLGARGRSRLAQLLLGRTAERVLRKAPCPVLTIPPQAYKEDPLAV